MRQVNLWPRVVAGLGLCWGLATLPTPANAVYQLVTQIPVSATAANPFNTGGLLNGAFTSYDISFFDPKTQLDYVADRANASVDVFSAATNTQVESIGGSVGLRAGTPAMPLAVNPPAPGTPAPVTAISGPDGVVIVNGAVGAPNQHQLWAGDGNSTLKAFTLNNSVPPVATPTLGNPPGINTGGQFRVDEMAFDPKDNIIAAANNADTPPFVTLVNAATGAILNKITFDGTNKGVPLVAGGGVEQPVWDKNTQRFYLSIPQIGNSTSDPGGIAQFAADGTVTAVFYLANFGIGSCSPAGLAVGNNSLLAIDCGAVGSATKSAPGIFFDPTANGGKGAVVATFNQLGGGDEAWFDPTTGYFFLTGYRDTAQPPGLLVIDGNTAVPSLVQFIPTSVGDHSVAVDPISGEVFVPTGGAVAGAVCPNGCILVFAQVAAVPEPASLTLIITAFAGFAGLVWSRRRRQS